MSMNEIVSPAGVYELSQDELRWLSEFRDERAAEAALRYALSVNRLHASWIVENLSPEVRYDSQSLNETMDGKTEVVSYLTSRFAAIAVSPRRVLAELGRSPMGGRPCVIIYQAEGAHDQNWKTRPRGFVELTVNKTGEVVSLFMITAVPSPQSAGRSELYPGKKAESDSPELKLSRDAPIDLILFVIDPDTGYDQMMINSIRAVEAQFPIRSLRIVRAMESPGFDEACKRWVGGMPVLFIESEGEVILRLDGLRTARGVADAIESVRMA